MITLCHIYISRPQGLACHEGESDSSVARGASVMTIKSKTRDRVMEGPAYRMVPPHI